MMDMVYFLDSYTICVSTGFELPPPQIQLLHCLGKLLFEIVTLVLRLFCSKSFSGSPGARNESHLYPSTLALCDSFLLRVHPSPRNPYRPIWSLAAFLQAQFLSFSSWLPVDLTSTHA
jgi:hypothetical protein